MQQLVALHVERLLVEDLDILDLLLEDPAHRALAVVGPQRFEDQLVQVVLLRRQVLDEGLLGEELLDRLLIVLLLLVYGLEKAQVVLVAALQGRVQLEEALLGFGERSGEVVQLGTGLHVRSWV